MIEERHIVALFLGEEMMRLLFYEGATLRCMRGIPPDARLLGINNDHTRHGIVAYFEHPSFPAHSIATEIPRTPVAFEVLEHPLREQSGSFPTRMGECGWEYEETERGKRSRGVVDDLPLL